MAEPMGRRRILAGVLASSAVAVLPLRAVEADLFAAASERAAGLDQLHAVVVVHDGVTLLSRAYRGPPPDRAVNVKSVSKTVVALLAGIAIDRGHLPGVEATLGDVAPGLIPAGADERVAALTVEDLLTMRAGLERTSGPNYGAFVSSADWVRYALSRPFETEPGTVFQYSTGSYHVLGAVLASVTNSSLLALAREWLGEPLGIAVPAWTRDPQGRYLGGNNMVLSPLALARIGEMTRAGGNHDGSPVVPPAWLDASFVPRVRSPWSGDLYGYGWFLTELAGRKVAYARGYGGQMLYVAPDAALTVAITSDPTRPAQSEGYVGDLHALVAEAIIVPLAS